MRPGPRYLTAFDLGANFFGYLPCGLLCVLALRPRLRPAAAVLLAVAAAAALSLSLEALQSFLPARIASNVDVIANVAGAVCGGIAGAWLAPGLLGGPLRRLRAEAVAPGAAADLGLTLLGLWLFAQLNPATLLFGTGDLRDLFSGAVGERHAAQLFVSVEAVTTAANLTAVGAAGFGRRAGGRAGAPAGGCADRGRAGCEDPRVRDPDAGRIRVRLAHARRVAGPRSGCCADVPGDAVAAYRPPGACRSAADGGDRARQSFPAQPVFRGDAEGLGAGALPQLQRPDAPVSAAWPFAALVYLVYLASARLREQVR